MVYEGPRIKSYMRRPVAVHAMRWRGADDETMLKNWLGNIFYIFEDNVRILSTEPYALPGDCIIKDAAGRFFVVSEPEFDENYSAVARILG